MNNVPGTFALGLLMSSLDIDVETLFWQAILYVVSWEVLLGVSPRKLGKLYWKALLDNSLGALSLKTLLRNSLGGQLLARSWITILVIFLFENYLGQLSRDPPAPACQGHQGCGHASSEQAI